MLAPYGTSILENLFPVVGGSLVACQGLKYFLSARRYGVRSWHRLLQPGGMPSSHVAVVTSLAITMGLSYGWSSPFFLLALTFGSIVAYDAITLRRAVGEHARRINSICSRDMDSQGDRLMENIGHSPMEVFIGFLIGLMLALINYY